MLERSKARKTVTDVSGGNQVFIVEAEQRQPKKVAAYTEENIEEIAPDQDDGDEKKNG